MKKTLEQINAVTAAINTEVLAQLHAVPTRKVEAPAMCACCARTAVPEEGDYCYSCEDLFDISDEERYDAEQEELENLSWLAEMEEELSNEPSPSATEEELEEMYDFFSCLRAPSAPTTEGSIIQPDGAISVEQMMGRRAHPDAPPTESEKIRFHNISQNVEWTQQEIAELERYMMFLHVYKRDSEDYQEAVLDTRAEIESKQDYLATCEADLRDLMPEHYAR